MILPDEKIRTTVVGSYPQPDWLIDREALAKTIVPRVRRADLWRIPQEHLEEAQDAATLAAIKEMEKAGVDIISDGEIRRESYSNRFATSLSGVELSTPGQIAGSNRRERREAHARTPDCGASSKGPASPGKRCGILAQKYRPPNQSNHTRPFYHGPASPERILP